jgi:hypothetical protein
MSSSRLSGSHHVNWVITLFVVPRRGPTAGPHVAVAAGAISINYGAFINTIIILLMVVSAIFLVIPSVTVSRKGNGLSVLHLRVEHIWGVRISGTQAGTTVFLLAEVMFLR